ARKLPSLPHGPCPEGHRRPLRRDRPAALPRELEGGRAVPARAQHPVFHAGGPPLLRRSRPCREHSRAALAGHPLAPFGLRSPRRAGGAQDLAGGPGHGKGGYRRGGSPGPGRFGPFLTLFALKSGQFGQSTCCYPGSISADRVANVSEKLDFGVSVLALGEARLDVPAQPSRSSARARPPSWLAKRACWLVALKCRVLRRKFPKSADTVKAAPAFALGRQRWISESLRN